MTTNKGRVKYVPPKVLETLDNIKLNYGYKGDADAFKKMAEFAPIGMELEKMRERFLLMDVFGKKKKK